MSKRTYSAPTIRRVIPYRETDGVFGYQEGDVLVSMDSGERSLVVRDGRGLVLAPFRRETVTHDEWALDIADSRSTSAEVIRHGTFGPIVWDTLTGRTRVATQEDMDHLPVGDDLTPEEEAAISE